MVILELEMLKGNKRKKTKLIFFKIEEPTKIAKKSVGEAGVC